MSAACDIVILHDAASVTHRFPPLCCLQDSRPGVEACAASASADPRSQAPVARSTLLLDKVPQEQLSVLDPRWDDDVLRYGQKIRLLANPAAQVMADHHDELLNHHMHCKDRGI